MNTLNRKHYGYFLLAFSAGLICALLLSRGIAAADSDGDPEGYFEEHILAEAVKMSPDEQQVFDLINDFRRQRGLAPFVACPQLTTESRRWSSRLRREGRLYHGASFENCARGSENGRTIFNMWLNSSGHRARFFDNTRFVGIGQDGGYWTLRTSMRNEYRQVTAGQQNTRTVTGPLGRARLVRVR